VSLDNSTGKQNTSQEQEYYDEDEEEFYDDDDDFFSDIDEDGRQIVHGLSKGPNSQVGIFCQ
jgi:hypothetical protein